MGPTVLVCPKPNSRQPSNSATIRCRSVWEAACRGGAATLFPFGDELPEDEQLDKLMSGDLADIPNLPVNPFGLVALHFGEWCGDEFRLSHDLNSGVEDGPFTIKGGAAQFWPWQDVEWVWCMCAMRMPSSALAADGRAALRPAVTL